jgi:hypothetical protein
MNMRAGSVTIPPNTLLYMALYVLSALGCTLLDSRSRTCSRATHKTQSKHMKNIIIRRRDESRGDARKESSGATAYIVCYEPNV